MSNIKAKKYWKYQILPRWNLNSIREDHNKDFDSETKAVEIAKELARRDNEDYYIARILYKISPEHPIRDIIVTEV